MAPIHHELRFVLIVYSESAQGWRQRIVRESEDPCKMAYSRMALNKRGLGAKLASSKLYAEARRAGCRSAHQQQHRFERGSAYLATQPLRLRNWNRKVASARPGLEPERCGRERRAQARAPKLPTTWR